MDFWSNFKKLAAIVIALVCMLFPLLASACANKSISNQTESLVVAWSPFEQGTLLWVAADQNIFSRNGLNVTLRKFDTGAGSLHGMLKGEADVAVGVAGLPVVRSAFNKSNVRIIGVAAEV